jgi:hypothetical protein
LGAGEAIAGEGSTPPDLPNNALGSFHVFEGNHKKAVALLGL